MYEVSYMHMKCTWKQLRPELHHVVETTTTTTITSRVLIYSCSQPKALGPPTTQHQSMSPLATLEWEQGGVKKVTRTSKEGLITTHSPLLAQAGHTLTPQIASTKKFTLKD